MNKQTLQRIGVVGAGYVGISNALVLSQNNNVVLFDIDQTKIKKLNSGKSPISEGDIDDFLKRDDISISFSTDEKKCFSSKDFILVCTPTSYDPEKDSFNLESVEKSVQKAISHSPNALIVIKSTIPIGCVDTLRQKFKYKDIVFSPEFLREGLSLSDNLNPSRIIVGGECKKSKKFGNTLLESTNNKDAPLLFMDSKSAECVKLFANNYLAMRVSFFNELDTFAMSHGIEAKDIIEGIKFDSRIGDFYNNPSFGYGGYCLPKDTKQLKASFNDVPQTLIQATIDSNFQRKKFMAMKILEAKPKSIGFYRLIMKKNSDNFRESSIQSIIDLIHKTKNIKFYLYEPNISKYHLKNVELISDISEFKKLSDLIITNRRDNNLNNVGHKLFTRDIFKNN